ncbi:hypothetical protein SRHO_G00191360 [Serrasalmus rhombeus]
MMKTLSVTLCFTAVLFSQYSVALTAGSVMKNQGETLTMACTTEDTHPIGVKETTAQPPFKEPSAMPEMLVLVSVLLVCTVFILCVLVTVVWVIPKVKALRAN